LTASPLLISTRKGLFVAEPGGGAGPGDYRVMRAAFVGDNVTLALADPRGGWWAQHHNGIFRSTDDMATWTEISQAGPSTFGFAVAVDPADPDTAWFVPAQSDEKRVPVGGNVVVTRTRDGGATFETLARGLPDQFAYDLVFRHALALAADGMLAFGSTTGNVFASRDRGESWTTVSNHLPPVHAVTFEGAG